MAVQVSRARMLPHPPQSYAKDEQDAAWYEHQERMRPSYISQPAFQYQQQVHYGPVTGASNAAAAPPPLSPSARWSAPAAPVKTGTAAQYKQRTGPPQQQQYYFPAEVPPLPSAANVAQPSFVNGASRPRPPQLQSAPSRFHLNGQSPFALSSDEDDDRRMGAAHGSAFMHKGFFDIMSLVNSQAVSSRIDSQPNGGGLKATFSKATGRLRKISMPGRQNQGIPEDDFFSSAYPAIYKAPSPLAPVSTNKLNACTSIPASTSAGGGIRAQKKRISVDMVGAPKIGTFVHAAHASDAEQAEEILRRWSRDGVGKIADPAWINRCKEALRVQYERNQAEAIAQVQAALHQDSMISNNPRALQIMNGAPSPSLTASNFTMSTATSTGTGATAGHSGAAQGNPFQGIAEERFEKSSRPVTPRRSLPATPPVASRPGMMPRTNTQGTILVAASPEAAAPEETKTPDYMHYQPNPQAALANSVEPESPTKRASKVIDGLPGTARGIGALFDRPVSMVVRDDPGVHGGVLSLAGELMASPLAAHAGAALRPSLTTVEKSVAAKIFFENLYYGILKKPRDRDTRKAGLERELAGLRIPESAKDDIRAAWTANETEYLRDIRARVNVNSFTRLKTIGHGAFGVVALVREQGTGQLFAMKQLRKADMLRKGQEGHVRAERDLMTSASASTNAKWIVKLVYSFQGVDHLYLIMEFMGGGDLLNLLIEKDIFAEDFARFYVAEMILAIHEAHQLGYIHRDIKPDNFLFTSQGHIKLADFGLCQSFHWAHDGAYYDQQRKQLLKKHGIDLEDSGATRAKRGIAASLRQQQAPQKGGYLDEGELNNIMSDRNEDGTPLTHVLTWRDKNKRKIAYSVVGTNNYMAPEVLRGLGYDQSCDWWSLGVIVFEMLYGYPPFVSKSRHLTRQKILNWRQTLRFPPKPKVSREAQDFIAKLICEKDDRLGSMNNASVSRPNSLLQGSRQPSGFAASGTDTPRANSAGLVDGVEDLMAHPWFRGVDWGRLHASKAPFRPALSHAADTKHFEDDIDDEPLPAPGAAEAAKDGQPVPVEQPRDPMLRDKAHGQHLLEMRKQLAFVGYTFKSPKDFDPKAQLTESKITRAEQGQQDARAHARLPTEGGSHLRSMSM